MTDVNGFNQFADKPNPIHKPIDLRNCKRGDKLRSIHGDILTYVGPTEFGSYYDHYVEYDCGTIGTRIHDGHVYRRVDSRNIEDHDIVEIIGQ